MDKKVVILIAVNALLVFYFIITSVSWAFLASTQPSSLEECNTLIYNGGDAVNLVFFAYKEEVQEYADAFLETPPYNENKDNFNFYYISPRDYRPECEIYQDKALLCYNKDTIKKAASCPHDAIVVIQDADRRIRSSDYNGIISINSKHSLSVLPHEFGHEFVNLADEYVPATLPRNSKNCLDSCDKFTIKDGCYSGCSKSEYFRSVENGLMRTLYSNYYGIFNEMLLINEISKTVESRSHLATGNALENPLDCADQMHYLVCGIYENEKITITDKKIMAGCASNAGSGEFEYSILTGTRSTMKQNFNIGKIFTDAQDISQDEIDGEVLEAEDMHFCLKIPIAQNAQTLEIKKENTLISQTNLQDVEVETTYAPCRKG